MKPLITNIQRFCVHDGFGIRTTVFFKGCSLHCPWCANPENISCKEQFYYIREKCKDSCKVRHLCKAYQIGVPDENDLENCYYGAIGKFGKYYSSEELYQELIKDKCFYGKDGGITFSGGEALLFLKEFDNVITRLRKDKINITVETALMVSKLCVLWAIDNIDNFYIDIKIVESNEKMNIIGGDINIFKRNLNLLSDNVIRDRIIYRIPVVEGITNTKKNLYEIQKLVLKYPPSYIEIFSVHNLGAKKYERLGLSYKKFNIVSKEELIKLKNEFDKLNIKCKIISL